MFRRQWTIPAFLAAALCCGVAHAAPPRLIGGADAAIWKGAVDSGPLSHIATGAVFDDKIASFSRIRIAAVDDGDDGDDVQLSYELKRGSNRTVATVYLFRPGDLPEHRLAGSLRALGTVSPTAFVWADGPFAIDAPRKLSLFKGTYKTGIGPDTVMDYLYFGNIGRWTVKVRATLPSPDDDAEEQAIDAFVRALPWQAILAANGACDGPVCTADRPMAIDHHMGEMFLSKAVAGQPDKLIKEIAYTSAGGGAQWQLARIPDEVAPLFSTGYGATSSAAPLYAVIRKKGSETRIVRFWSRLPSEAAFAQAVKILADTPEEGFFITAGQAASYAAE